MKLKYDLMSVIFCYIAKDSSIRLRPEDSRLSLDLRVSATSLPHGSKFIHCPLACIAFADRTSQDLLFTLWSHTAWCRWSAVEIRWKGVPFSNCTNEGVDLPLKTSSFLHVREQIVRIFDQWQCTYRLHSLAEGTRNLDKIRAAVKVFGPILARSVKQCRAGNVSFV
jgi:hypothetical protein